MKYRTLGKTGYRVSEISFGAWAIGGAWGSVEDERSLAAIHRAIDLGINFFDTADVYGDGRSERLLRQAAGERSEKIYIATKAGRRLQPHVASGYNRANLTAFIERSLENLGTDCIDLLQLHCPPTEAYENDRLFEALDELREKGLMRHYGVSVETVDEALRAVERPGVATIQIIFNMFRHKPAHLLFEKAKSSGVGLLARVPLASGLLTGKFTSESRFERDDHRQFNRHGEAFDRGETFSGVDFQTGLQAVSELQSLVKPGNTLAQTALRWILMFDAVSCAIPGAKTAYQVEENAAASDLPPLTAVEMDGVRGVYDRYFKRTIEPLW